MSTPWRISYLVMLGSLIASIGACATDDPGLGSSAGSPSSTVTTSEPLGEPSVDGRFAVASDGHQQAMRCWGDGTPTIVFEAGSDDAGLRRWNSSSMFRELALRTRVCTYDRAGTGVSDPAPARRRNLDDVVGDLHQLLSAAQVPPPYLLVGSSGGGFDIYHYAGRHPEEVVGLVLLDVPPGQAHMSAVAVVELAWDNPGNHEHVDYVAVERQMALHRLPIPAIPVTVVTVTAGQSAADPVEQRIWLEGSSHPVQVVLNGGHEIDVDDSKGVLAEILRMLELVRSAS
jgi:hypothetical protein